MKKVLLVLSSVRKGRAADTILAQVQGELKNFPGYEVQVADFAALPLPFFDSPATPSADDYVIDNENVKVWSGMVANADAVVFLTAEYNHSYTPILKNAIDWLYKEWIDKPVAFIGYGWVGGARAIKHLRDVMASNIAAKPIETEANLAFTKQIDLDGSALNDDAKNAINNVLKAL